MGKDHDFAVHLGKESEGLPEAQRAQHDLRQRRGEEKPKIVQLDLWGVEDFKRLRPWIHVATELEALARGPKRILRGAPPCTGQRKKLEESNRQASMGRAV